MDKRFRLFAVLVLLLAAVCAYWFAKPEWKNAFQSGEKAEQETVQEVQQVTEVPTEETSLVLADADGTLGVENITNPSQPSRATESSGTSDASEPSGTETAKAAQAYISPIDFTALQAKNPDIYAWLSIEGTDISYPVLQSTDDSFYLNHDENRAYASEGSIFSESAYNGRTFEDSITVLYGHHMKSGKMFENLQELYSDPEQFEKLRDIVIYTPEKELHYRVFAAAPYDNRHVIYRYGKDGDIGLLNFQDSLRAVKSLDAIFDKENMATAGDRILVLSTCLMGDRTRRFLVAAKLVQPE